MPWSRTSCRGGRSALGPVDRGGLCNECDEPVKPPAYITCDMPAFPIMEPDGTELCYLLVFEAPTPVCFPPYVPSGGMMCEDGTKRLQPQDLMCGEGFTLSRDMRCVKEVYKAHGYVCPKGYYLEKSLKHLQEAKDKGTSGLLQLPRRKPHRGWAPLLLRAQDKGRTRAL